MDAIEIVSTGHWRLHRPQACGAGNQGYRAAHGDGAGVERDRPREVSRVEWRGVGNPTECTFGGNDQFKMAFGGTKKNSLTNYIASKYPALMYSQDDMWGYCKSGRPIIVIPPQHDAVIP